jgi:uncharacterized protein YhaN
MRIVRLSLTAFGPFHEEELTLGEGPGLDIVFGPNEAGKSTALRAITGLLFGIPERTSDAHTHPMPRLRIGARLRSEQGEELRVVRRKGKRGTLFDEDGTAIDDTVLERMMAGVSRPMFQSMFGIDHRGLREGGEALLAGRGDVGESLFDAAGARGVHQVLTRLHEEADAIYKSRGQNPKLNDALKRLEQAREQVMLSSLRGEAFIAQRTEVEATKSSHERLVSQRSGLMADQSRLQRALRVMPALSKRRDLADQVALLCHVVALEPNARDERHAVMRELDAATAEEARLTHEMVALEARTVELEQSCGAIAQLDESVVSDLSDRLGAFRRASSDVLRRRAELAALRSEIQVKLAHIGRGPADLRVREIDRLRIDQLVAEHERLEERLAHLEQRWIEQQSRRKTIGVQLDADKVPLATSLEAAVSRAVRAGDLEAGRARAELTLVTARSELDRLLATLRWLPEGARTRALALELSSLPAADARELDRLEEEIAEVRRARASQAARSKELEQHRERARTALARLDLAGDIPSEEQLAHARERRDRLLTKLEQDWPATIDDYRRAVSDADLSSDRLRREAGRVAERVNLMAELQALEREAQALAAAAVDVDKLEESLLSQHRHLFDGWPGTPVAPRHARARLEQRDAAIRALTTVERAEAELAVIQAAIRRHTEAVLGGLSEAGSTLPADASLSQAIDLAQAVVAHVARARERRVLLEQTHADALAREQVLEQQVSECSSRLGEWRERWARAMETLDLPGDASIAEANLVLVALGEVQAKRDAADTVQHRIDGIERDARIFSAEVAALVAEYAPDLTGAADENAATELRERHRKARAASEELARVRAELAAKRSAHADARARCERARAALSQRLARAGATDLQELEHAEAQSDHKRSLEAQLADADEQLYLAGDGATVTELTELTAGVDVDRARARLAELDGEIGALNEAIDETSRTLGNLQHTLIYNFEQREGAFRAANELESCLSEVERHAEEWARLRLASVLLEQEVEHYRQQNQGPILARANELFPQLSLGSFRELKVDLRGDENRLRCVRENGDEVEISGLSEGTRDQLYLALRLATLERFALRCEPMPLVLDDICINFDDQRARAALLVLFEVSRKLQVLFFTHHEHLIDLAREAARQLAASGQDEPRISIHRLREKSPPVARPAMEQSRPA